NSSSSGSAISQLAWRIADASYFGNPAQVPLMQAGPQDITHTVVTADGCVASASRTFTVNASAIRGSSDTTIVVGEALVLKGSGGVAYNWTYIPPATPISYIPGEANLPVFTGLPGKDFMFVLTGRDAQGCGGIDTVRVTISQFGYAFVPSAFSPNGDGRNDILRAKLSG